MTAGSGPAADDAPNAYCATERGIGADNPTRPGTLTDLERSRAVMFTFEQASSFDIGLIVRRLGDPNRCCRQKPVACQSQA